MSNENVPRHTRPFNFEQARAGAPIGRRDGKPIRVMCFDKKTQEGTPIVVLADHGTYEVVVFYTTDGKLDRFDTKKINKDSDLVMLPFGLLFDKPLFVGDILDIKVTGTNMPWMKFMVPSDWRGLDSSLTYRWPEEIIIFKDRELRRDSMLWYNTGSIGQPNWIQVRASDETSFLIHGIAETIFDRLKRGENGVAQFYSWERPKVKKEVWQAVYRSKHRGKYYGVTTYGTEKVCSEACRHDDSFLAAELTDTYYE